MTEEIDYAAIKADSRQRKERNRAGGHARLTELGIPFTEKNGGVHLIVAARWDYWPSTGLWICRTTKRSERGIRSLIKEIQRVIPGYRK